MRVFVTGVGVGGSVISWHCDLGPEEVGSYSFIHPHACGFCFRPASPLRFGTRPWMAQSVLGMTRSSWRVPPHVPRGAPTRRMVCFPATGNPPARPALLRGLCGGNHSNAPPRATSFMLLFCCCTWFMRWDVWPDVAGWLQLFSLFLMWDPKGVDKKETNPCEH